MGRLARLPGDIVVRFLLDVSHYENFAGGLSEPPYRVECFLHFFRVYQLAQGRSVVGDRLCGLLQSYPGAPTAGPSPVEGQIYGRPAGVGIEVRNPGGASRML